MEVRKQPAQMVDFVCVLAVAVLRVIHGLILQNLNALAAAGLLLACLGHSARTKNERSKIDKR